jgi:hypothetical protein
VLGALWLISLYNRQTAPSVFGKEEIKEKEETI